MGTWAPQAPERELFSKELVRSLLPRSNDVIFAEYFEPTQKKGNTQVEDIFLTLCKT